jgi:hypothetical protein
MVWILFSYMYSPNLLNIASEAQNPSLLRYPEGMIIALGRF